VAEKSPEYIPGGHSKHELLASTALKKPGTHDLHTSDCEKKNASQFKNKNKIMPALSLSLPL
jgi:hypothetical protein